MLHLGEVEVRTEATLNELMGIVEEIERKVENRARDSDAVDQETRVGEVPSSGTGRNHNVAVSIASLKGQPAKAENRT